jgi:hypothetical protein
MSPSTLWSGSLWRGRSEKRMEPSIILLRCGTTNHVSRAQQIRRVAAVTETEMKAGRRSWKTAKLASLYR